MPRILQAATEAVSVPKKYKKKIVCINAHEENVLFWLYRKRKIIPTTITAYGRLNVDL